MKIKIYAIRDKAACAFQNPFYMHTDAMAERAFRNLISDPSSQVSKNPEDFDLFFLGLYHTDSGEIESAVTKLVSALELLKPEK